MKTPSYLLQTLAFGFCLLGLLIGEVYTKTAFGQSGETAGRIPFQGKAEFITANPFEPEMLFIGAAGTLYISKDQGKNWKRSIGLGSNAKINQLHFEPDRAFLLTSEGLFESSRPEGNWKKIFQGRQNGENNTFSLSRDPSEVDTIYLGTAGGLFVSRDNARTFRKETGRLARERIQELKADPDNQELFIVSDRGLYRLLTRRKQLDHVYFSRRAASETLETELDLAGEFDLDLSNDPDEIRAIALSGEPPSAVAIGTRSGVWVSEDEGNHWKRLPMSGLTDTDILDLVYSPEQNSYFAATKEGIYFFARTENRWEKVQGFPSVEIHRLTLVRNDSEMLLVSTADGPYRVVIDIPAGRPEFGRPFPERRWNHFIHLAQAEPTIGIIQKQAIRYANVSNWKTKRWQWASRMRALIPSFSVGKDFSRGDNIDLDRGGTNDPDVYIVGPPAKNEGLDFDLQWDLSDLIWNSAQTSIDSREKLMVELRDDILSEITRLYFERRRAQVEFLLQTPENVMDQMNQLLRIDELTANLDALTDGYLTKQLHLIYVQHPEFYELWSLSL